MSHINFSTKTEAPADMLAPISIVVDHPNEMSAATEWDLDFHQIEPGPLQTKLCLFGTDNLQLAHLRMSKMVRQTGRPPIGWMTFGITDATTIKSWQNKQLDRSSLLCFGAQDGFESTSLAGHDGLVMSVREPSFEKYAGIYDIDPTPVAGRTLDYTGRDNHAFLVGLRSLALSVLSNTASEAIDNIQEDISLGVLSLIDKSTEALIHVSPRYRGAVLKRAMSRIVASADQRVSIATICEEESIPWRTLNRAFRDEFGIGPKTFQTFRRLNRVRFDLANGSTAQSVSDVANRYDFWHLGQFAKDYRHLFGELSSETLSRAEPRRAQYLI